MRNPELPQVRLRRVRHGRPGAGRARAPSAASSSSRPPPLACAWSGRTSWSARGRGLRRVRGQHRTNCLGSRSRGGAASDTKSPSHPDASDRRRMLLDGERFFEGALFLWRGAADAAAAPFEISEVPVTDELYGRFDRSRRRPGGRAPLSRRRPGWLARRSSPSGSGTGCRPRGVGVRLRRWFPGDWRCPSELELELEHDAGTARTRKGACARWLPVSRRPRPSHLHGTVREWCADVYDQDFYAVSPVVDPIARGVLGPPPRDGSCRGGRFTHGGRCAGRGTGYTSHRPSGPATSASASAGAASSPRGEDERHDRNEARASAGAGEERAAKSLALEEGESGGGGRRAAPALSGARGANPYRDRVRGGGFALVVMTASSAAVQSRSLRAGRRDYSMAAIAGGGFEDGRGS